jgi:hypothetical protein
MIDESLLYPEEDQVNGYHDRVVCETIWDLVKKDYMNMFTYLVNDFAYT